MLALDAQIVVRSSSGERTVGANEFFTGLFETALGPTDLLTEIRVPEADWWLVVSEVSPSRSGLGDRRRRRGSKQRERVRGAHEHGSRCPYERPESSKPWPRARCCDGSEGGRAEHIAAERSVRKRGLPTRRSQRC